MTGLCWSWCVADKDGILSVNDAVVRTMGDVVPFGLYLVQYNAQGTKVELLDSRECKRVPFTVTTDGEIVGSIRPVNDLSEGTYVAEIPVSVLGRVSNGNLLIPEEHLLCEFRNIENSGDRVVTHGTPVGTKVIIPGGKKLYQTNFMTRDCDDTFFVQGGSRKISSLGLMLMTTNKRLVVNRGMVDIPDMGITVMLPTVEDGVEVEVQIPDVIHQVGKPCIYYPYDADGSEKFRRKESAGVVKSSAGVKVSKFVGRSEDIREVLDNATMLNEVSALLDKIEGYLPPSVKSGSNVLLSALRMLDVMIDPRTVKQEVSRSSDALPSDIL